eukprot:XP_011670860.1 PREDICTED: fibropellin-1-like [Strongylocentrotus purpuratus]
MDTVASQCNEVVCLNGGSCFQSTTTGEYICTCIAGFTGDTCGNDIGACIPNPCRNNGFCSATGNGYRCACLNGYTGTNCDVPTSASCSPDPCQNGGKCLISSNGAEPTCSCPVGYSGTSCQIPPVGAHATNIKMSAWALLLGIITLLMGLYQ